MIDEKWVKTVSASHEVSSFGRVRNCKTGKILTPWPHRSGHLYINLGRKLRFQVHRLVLQSFGIFPTEENMECRHIDGNPKNNHIENLEWGTRRENIEDLKKHSGKYPRAIVPDETAMEILQRFTGKHGEQTQLAEEYGLGLSTVNKIINGRHYVHLGC